MAARTPFGTECAGVARVEVSVSMVPQWQWHEFAHRRERDTSMTRAVGSQSAHRLFRSDCDIHGPPTPLDD